MNATINFQYHLPAIFSGLASFQCIHNDLFCVRENFTTSNIIMAVIELSTLMNWLKWATLLWTDWWVIKGSIRSSCYHAMFVWCQSVVRLSWGCLKRTMQSIEVAWSIEVTSAWKFYYSDWCVSDHDKQPSRTSHNTPHFINNFVSNISMCVSGLLMTSLVLVPWIVRWMGMGTRSPCSWSSWMRRILSSCCLFSLKLLLKYQINPA